jgi:hypothetical protein
MLLQLQVKRFTITTQKTIIGWMFNEIRFQRSSCICGEPGRSFCVGYHAQRYCSKACRKVDWKSHKRHCVVMLPKPEDMVRAMHKGRRSKIYAIYSRTIETSRKYTTSMQSRRVSTIQWHENCTTCDYACCRPMGKQYTTVFTWWVARWIGLYFGTCSNSTGRRCHVWRCYTFRTLLDSNNPHDATWTVARDVLRSSGRWHVMFSDHPDGVYQRIAVPNGGKYIGDRGTSDTTFGRTISVPEVRDRDQPECSTSIWDTTLRRALYIAAMSYSTMSRRR